MISDVLKDKNILQDSLDYIEYVKGLDLDKYPRGFTDCLANGPRKDNIPFLTMKNGFYVAEDSMLEALRMDDIPSPSETKPFEEIEEESITEENGKVKRLFFWRRKK